MTSNPGTRICAVSMPVSFDVSVNVSAIEQSVHHAAQEGSDLVVLPELAAHGYLWGDSGVGATNLTAEQLRSFYERAEEVPGALTDRVARLAAEHNLHIVFGLVERGTEQGGAILYNSAVLIGPAGVVGVYRKVHLPSDEHHVFNEGESWPVFDTPLGRIGLMICYDICFPEAARSLALAGAEIICFPTAWAAAGEPLETDEWIDALRIFTRARAMENQVWLVVSNQAGTCARSGWTYGGESGIIDPQGRVLSSTGSKQGCANAVIDVDGGVLDARTGFLDGLNLLKDRRPYSYTPPAATSVEKRTRRS